MTKPAGHGRVVSRLEALLRGLLSSNRWSIGDRLPSEPMLAEEFGVGRSSVREAVRLLVRDGLLEVRQGSGTYVVATVAERPDIPATLRRARLLEVYEVRRSLEVEAARLAAARAHPDEILGLRALLAKRQRLADADPATFVPADLELHRAVVELAGNSVLSQLYGMVLPIIRSALIDLMSNDGPLPDTGTDHDDLVDALERGDAEAAIAATLANLDIVMDVLRAR